MYSKMAEIGMELDKADFAVNGYEVDERKYPRQGPKEPSTSGAKKMKVDDTLMIDLSEEESSDSDANSGFLDLGDGIRVGDPVLLGASDGKGEQSQGHSIPLVGSRLGVVNADEDENEDLARARLDATPWRLFTLSSQQTPSDHRQEGGPSFSSPLPPLNRPAPRRSNALQKMLTHIVHQ